MASLLSRQTIWRPHSGRSVAWDDHPGGASSGSLAQRLGTSSGMLTRCLAKTLTTSDTSTLPCTRALMTSTQRSRSHGAVASSTTSSPPLASASIDAKRRQRC